MLRRLSFGTRRLWGRLTGPSQSKELVEEETVTACTHSDWYPVAIGEVFLDQYEVLGKLGWGQTSTVWFCKDAESGDFKVLKMCIHDRGHTSREEEAYDAMRGIKTSNIGVRCLRLHLDEFDVTGPSGYNHHGFIFAPAACNIAQVMRVVGHVDILMVKLIMRHTLLALDFVHRDVHCVHTDIKANNVLLKLDDRTVLEEFARSLKEIPPISKGSREKGTLVYRSRQFKDLGRTGWDAPILTDLGEARLLGNEADYEPLTIGPEAHRAPENVLNMRWSYPVDIWQAGCMFYNLLTQDQLFTMADSTNKWCIAAHLAQMVALMGPPPVDFVSRSESCRQFFDEKGHWKGDQAVIQDVQYPTLEQKFARVQGVEASVMLDFIRGMLHWRPEDRKTARQLLQHRFLSDEEPGDAEAASGKSSKEEGQEV